MEAYLKDSVNSVRNQTYPNLEIILVDDGSPDRCGQMCDEFAKLDERIKVIHQENAGLSSARNTGLEIATGKYVMFLDSDDTFELDACEKLYHKIAKEDADYVIANYRNMDDDGTKWENPIFNQERYQTFQLRIEDYGDSFFVMNSVVWNKIYNRQFIEDLRLRFIPGLPAEDAMFTTYCYIKAERVFYMNDIVCNYRQRGNNTSISNNCSRAYFKGINKAYQIIYQNFKENDRIGFYRYFYAKSMTYMLYKFIDSQVLTDEERIEVLQEMRWFYELHEILKVPACQRSLDLIINAIVAEEYKEAINYCTILAEFRSYLPMKTKMEMSKPDKNLYTEMAKFDEEYARKETSNV